MKEVTGDLFLLPHMPTRSTLHNSITGLLAIGLRLFLLGMPTPMTIEAISAAYHTRFDNVQTMQFSTPQNRSVRSDVRTR